MISLRGVSKTFGSVRALSGVTTRLVPGQVTVVTGANGSGKSTLLALLGTLAKPTSGEMDHGALGRSRAQVRRAIGWLGHETLCYPDLTGIQNIELAARLHDVDPVRAVGRARERFDLGAFADRPVRTYSRGQRQRVALARALVHGPRLLLLDEPTAGLDASSVARLEAVVAEETKAGVLVVLVTHDLGFAEKLGGRILTLERGRMAGGSWDVSVGPS